MLASSFLIQRIFSKRQDSQARVVRVRAAICDSLFPEVLNVSPVSLSFGIVDYCRNVRTVQRSMYFTLEIGLLSD